MWVVLLRQKWCPLCLLHPVLNTLSGGPCPGECQSLGPVYGLSDNTSLSLSPFSLKQLGKWREAPPLVYSYPWATHLWANEGPGSCKECLMKQMTTYLPLEWIIWIFFLAYFPSLFSMKTHVCALNPDQRIIRVRRKALRCVNHRRPDTWGKSTCQGKITGFEFKIRCLLLLCDLVSLLSLLVSFTEWPWGWNGIVCVKGMCCYFLLIKGPQHRLARSSVPGCPSNPASASPSLNTHMVL